MSTGLQQKEVITKNAKQTQEFAAKFVRFLPVNSVIGLTGKLGTGKTCFIQGLAQGLGIHEPICSPTFTVIREYHGKYNLYHIDLYRLNSPQEIWDLNLEDYYERGGITTIEWADRLNNNFPDNMIQINLNSGENLDERLISVQANLNISQIFI